MGLLKEECHAFETDLSEIDPMLPTDDYETLRREVDKLANGIVEGRVREFIAKRTKFASSTRAAQKDHFVGRGELKRKLKALSESQLAQWLVLQALAPSGAEILYAHLERMFGPGPAHDYAPGVLLSPVGNAARGLVRADLYYNWRCANRDSNPKDLMDDMLHVLQSIYCDVYATEERNHSEYASFLLTPRTRVAIYDRQTPVDHWLESLT
jgi:hypothetical protein